MKFGFFTDSHFTDTQPPQRIDDVRRTQRKKLGEILHLILDHGVQAIFHGGDVFNTKKPSHLLVADIIDWCKRINIPIYSVIGNHDVTGYNLDSVRNSGLGVLFEAEAVTKLNLEEYPNEKIAIKAIHVEYDPQNFGKAYIFDEKYKDYIRIIISHNYVIPEKEMPFGFVHPKDIETNAHLVLCGHYHKPFTFSSGNEYKTLWVNPGSLCRWNVLEDHQPKFILVTIENGKWEIKQLPLQNGKNKKEVFNLELIDLQKKQEQDVKKFVQSLEQTAFQNVDVEELISKIGKEQNLDPNIIELVLKKVRHAKEVLK